MLESLRDTGVTRERMIVEDAGDEKAEVESVGDVDGAIAKKETFGVDFEAMLGEFARAVFDIADALKRVRICGQALADLFRNYDRIENDIGKELRRLQENFAVMRVVGGVTAIRTAGVNIASSRKCVWLFAKTACAIVDDEPLFL